MPDRPHRMAKILDGKNLGIVSLELLKTLASFAPVPEKHQSTSNGHYQGFNLDDFIARHGIAVKRVKEWNGNRLFILEACPFNPDHNHGEAHVQQFPSGALQFACKHNGCVGKRWHDLREIYEPGYRDNGNGSREQVTVEANENRGLPVTVPNVEREIDLSDAPFPEKAWTGFFGQWRDMIGSRTEAPLEYLWGAFLLAVGVMIGRSAWRDSPRPLFPNFYLLLTGRTGDSRKSTVLWFAEQLLKNLGEDTESIYGIVSTEGLIERLAKREETKALGYADEFRSLLAVAKRKGTQDIIPRLNSL